MIVTLNPQADAARVERELAARGLWAERYQDEETTVYRIAPSSAALDPASLEALEGVGSVIRTPSRHPLLDRQPAPAEVAGVRFGAGAPPVVLAGPCSVESEEQIHRLAARLAPLGVDFLRGGAFKPRTSPYDFQGLGEPALGWMREAADAHGLKVVTELLAAEDAEKVGRAADLVQVGSRNMHNTALLRTAGSLAMPVLLKRGMAATIDEWLLAAEYLLMAGAPSVIFCERGIRGFDPSTRNVLDLGAAALLSQVHGLPVVVDPSHGAGRRDLIPALSRAALAAGAAGLMLETHDDPGGALSDGPQALLPDQLESLLAEMGVSTPEGRS